MRYLLFFIALFPSLLLAQHPGNDESALQEHLSGADAELGQSKPGQPDIALQPRTEAVDFDTVHGIQDTPHESPEECNLGGHIVYGFHPHWMGTAWKSYNYKLLSHLSYFAYQIDCETGGIRDIGDFDTTGLFDFARAANPTLRLDLTLTTNASGCSSREFLNNPSAVDTCIATTLRLMRAKKLSGICVDFEDIKSRDTLSYGNFLLRLDSAMEREFPGATLSIAGYASGVTSRQNLVRYRDLLDFVVVMGYDYYYAGAKGAGPVAPVGGEDWKHLSLSKTVENYVEGGLPKNKLVLALPYYGYQWSTNSDEFTAQDATSTGKAILYRTLVDQIASDPDYTRKFESGAESSYFVKKVSDGYLQAWVPDSAAMAAKFDLVLDQELAGTGIWALGYDNGHLALWNLLQAKFMDCRVVPDTSATDGGGMSAGDAPATAGDDADSSDSYTTYLFIGAIVLIAALLIGFFLRRKS